MDATNYQAGAARGSVPSMTLKRLALWHLWMAGEAYVKGERAVEIGGADIVPVVRAHSDEWHRTAIVLSRTSHQDGLAYAHESAARELLHLAYLADLGLIRWSTR